MSIKLIAVDMDGTFLNDDKEYDKDRFLKQYELLKRLGIKFVVASGNQAQHLYSFFPEIQKEITFIAENGAKVITENKLIYKNSIPSEKIKDILGLLENNVIFKEYRLVMSGEKAAYINKNAPVTYKKKAQFFYKNLIEVDNYFDVEDVIYKFAFNFQKDLLRVCENELNNVFCDSLKAVTSGHEALDLVSKTAGKEKGITVLSNYWEIPSKKMAAFGDNLNDLEMLKNVEYAFVMENGREELKKMATKVIGLNNEMAVLDEIDLIIEECKKDKVTF